MVCPHCGRKLNEGQAAARRCPGCGGKLDGSPGGVMKTVSVRVASAEEDRVFHSIEEIPPETRRKLHKAISGPHAETILIADEEGRQRIFQAIRNLPPNVQKKVMAALQASPSGGTPPGGAARALKLGLLVGALTGLGLLLIWLWH